MENNWISVKDRLPEKGDKVLVYGRLESHKERYTAIYEGDISFSTCHFCESSSIDDVTHWMALPKPPE